MHLHTVFLRREIYKAKIGFVRFFNIIKKIITRSVPLPCFFSLTVSQKAFHADIPGFISFFLIAK